MTWQTVLYFSSIILTCILTGFLAWYAWRQPALPGVRTYSMMALSGCLSVLTEIFSMLSRTQMQALFWHKLGFIFNAATPVLWLMFALEYNGRKDWLSKRLRIGMFIIPLITQVVIWSDKLWVKQDVSFRQNGSFWIAETSALIPDLWFMVHSFYSLILFLTGVGVILFTAWHKWRVYRGQALLISAGALVALATTVIQIFNLLPQAEFNPFIPGIGISALLYALAILRFKFLKHSLTQESLPYMTSLKAHEKRSVAFFIFFFILFASSITAASYITYQNYEKQFRAQVESQLSAIASLKMDELEDWRNERLMDANLFYRNESFSELVRGYLENPTDTGVQNRLVVWLEKIHTNPEYDRVSLFDADGREWLSSPAATEPFRAHLADQVAPTLASDQITILDFHRDATDGHIHLAMIVPIYDPQNGSPLGVVVLHINPNVYLYPFIERWPASSQSAETLLIRREGGEVLYLNDLKFKRDTALNLRIPLENENIPAVNAALGFEGIMEGVDYRGVQVIADVHAVPGSPWFLVSEIDTAEVYTPLRERLWQTVLFFGVLILMAGAGLILGWRQQRMRYFRSQVETLGALRISEEKFRLAFSTSPDVIAINTLADGKFVSINKSFEQISGYTQEQAVGKTTSEINTWKDPNDLTKIAEELQAKGEIKNYEAAFLTQNGMGYGLVSASIIELNGVPHILSITRDITERRQVEEKLSASEERYRQLFENSPIGIYRATPDGRILAASPALVRMLGFSSFEELSTHNLEQDDAGATYPRRLFKEQIEREGRITGLETEWHKRDGTPIFVRENAQVIRDENGTVLYYEGTTEDITEHKRVEEQLHLQSAALKAVANTIVITDREGLIEWANPSFAALTGFDPAEAVGKNPSALIKSGVQDDDFYKNLWDTILSGQVWRGELVNRRKDGSLYSEEMTITPLLNQQGQVNHFIAVKQDITERKWAEEALRRAEENYRDIFENSLGGIFQSTPTGQFITVNPALSRMLGYDSPEDLVFTITDIAAQVYINPDVRSEHTRLLQEQGGDLFGFEYQAKRKDGSTIWVAENVHSVRGADGSLRYYEGVVEDISTRKKAEEALRLSEASLNRAQSVAHIGSWNLDVRRNILTWSAETYRIFGVPLETPLIYEAFLAHVHPDDVNLVNSSWQAALQGAAYDIAHRILVDGQVKWVRERAELETDADGNPLYGAGTVQDITERKQAEEALRASEIRFRSLFENAPIGVLLVDAQGNILEVNPDALRILGSPTAEATRKINILNFQPLVEAGISAEFQECVRTRQPLSSEHHYTTKWGKSIDMNMRFTPLVEADGKPMLLQILLEDITDRKQAEKALRESESGLNRAQTIAHIGSWNLDITHNITTWSAETYRIFGLPPEAPLAYETFLTYVHPDDVDFVNRSWLAALQGAPYDIEHRIFTNGQMKWVRERAELDASPESNILRITGTVQDITERKLAEDELRQSEERFQQLANNLEESFWITDVVSGREIYISPAGEKIWGMSIENLCQGRHAFLENILIEDRYIVLDAMERQSRGAKTEMEYRIQRPDGSIRWVWDRAFPIFDETGKVLRVTGIAADITERKQVEIEIKERTEDLELINTMNEAVNHSGDLDSIIKLFVEKIGQISLYKYATIHLLSSDGKNLVMQNLGLSPDLTKEVEQLIGGPLTQIQIPVTEGSYFQHALQSEQGIIVNDPKTIQHWMREFTGETNNLPLAVRMTIRKRISHVYKLLDIHSTLILPLISDKKIIGLLNVSSTGLLTEKDLIRIRKISGHLTAVILHEQANKAMLESEKRYRSIFEGVQDAIFIESKDGRVLEVNNRACEIYGYNREEFLGKTVRDLVPEGNDIFSFSDTQKYISSAPFETVNRRANGGLFPIEISGKALTINDEEILLAIVRDITERKKAEEALAASEAKLRALVEQVPAIIYTESAETRKTLYISPQVEKITGYTPAEWVNDCDIWKKMIHPEDLAALLAEDERTAETREPFYVEYRILTRDGRTIWIRDEAVMIENQDGTPLFWQGVMSDITERKQTEKALRASEERFKTMFEQAPLGIALINSLTGHIYEVNPRFAEIAGRSMEEMTNIDWMQITHPDDIQADLDNMALMNAGKTNGFQMEKRYLHPDNTAVWINMTIARLKVEDKAHPRHLCMIENITERKQAEKNIHQRVKELELLYESGLAFSQLLNPKEIAHKIIELLEQKMNWHHTAIRLVHAQDENLELVAFDQPGLGNKAVEAHLSKFVTRFGEGLTGLALQQSKIVRTGDVGSDPHYVESYPGIHSGLYVPLKSGDHMLGVISIESEKPDAFSEADEKLIATLANQAANAFENARLYKKISRYAEELERSVKERTSEIESTRQRLELAVKTAGIGIWELDIKQNKDYWDDRLFTLYGLSKEDASPSPKTWHNAIHPDDLARQLKLMDESLHNNQPYNTEFRVIWPDESIHFIKSTGVVIYNVAGLPERMIGANQDITIHKQAEETLRFANAEMERGLRMKNEFLANMSHELRTPLNAILGISESLEEQISGILNEKQLKYVRIISESGRHLLELINDVLDLSKIEAGKLELNVQSISVEKLCTSSLRMVKELAQKKSLNVSFKMDEKVKVISGDERRLKQSLVNLLGNAVKFTPHGKKIGLEVDGNIETNEITFTVWDEGIGINQEDIKRLFKPFVQLNAGLAREFAGTGLGLALVAQMMRLHGGRINLTSELKVGSRFMITLPWMPTEQEIKSPVKPIVLTDNSKSGVKRTGKILVVDDTEVVAQLISEYLRHKGYETLLAYNGKEAISLARQEHPQIILMDVMMPVMNGLDATRNIRADAELRDIPIIALTALAMPDDREQCLAAGMNDHLSKPIQMQELIQVIERYITKTS